MNIQVADYHFNPFALSTTGKEWADSESILPAKICHAAGHVAYDIFVKNPYDLTIGNCRKLIEAKKLPSVNVETGVTATAVAGALHTSTILKVGVSATAVFGLLYTLMLYGATFHILGASLAALGTKTGLATLSKVAEVSKAVGKNLFVSGAVPIYGTFYALPKQIIIALPPLAREVAAKISLAANWTFQNVLTPFWNQVLLPSLQTLGKHLSYLVNEIGRVFSTIAKTVAKSAQQVFQNIIVPAWNQFILPALKFAGNVISAVARTVGESLHTLMQETAKAASYIFQNIMIPAWDKLILPALKFTGRMISVAAKFIGHNLYNLAQAISRGASLIFQKAVVPAFNKLVQVVVNGGNFLGNHVIKPLGALLTEVAAKTTLVFKAIVDNTIVPIVEVVANSVMVLGSAMMDFSQEVWQAINDVVIRAPAPSLD